MADAEGKLPGFVFEAVGEVGAQDGIVVDLSEADASAKAGGEVERG